MLLQSSWTPRLIDAEGSPVDRLADALAADIIEGRIDSGDRLPAHRDLAYRVGVAVGTVTKAYAILERRGLVRTVKGSGTFVAAVVARRGPSIDLSRNVPPAVISERVFARTLTAIAKRIDSGLFNSYPPTAGHDEYRRQTAQWLARLGMEANPSRILLTSGAHTAIMLAFSVAAGREGVLFTEAQTYTGAIAIARHVGCNLLGLEMDGQGLLPEALDRAAKIAGTARKAVYVTPTNHNPTTCTMGRQRREDIVRVCRKHDIQIIEDDVYRLEASADLLPLAMLSPEKTFYISSLSKTLNPALRIGALVSPDYAYAAVEDTLASTALMISPMTCAVFEQLLIDGTAETLTRAVTEEAARRQKLARSILDPFMARSDYPGYHLWLPMAADRAQRLADAAKALDILVTPPRTTMVDPASKTTGIRLCIGAPPYADLTPALTALSALLVQMGREPSEPQTAMF